MVEVTAGEGLPFMLAAAVGIAVCTTVIALVIRQRRHAILVAAGPTYAVLQGVGGIIWMISTLVFNGHLSGYSPRLVALPTCFFWRYWMSNTLGFGLWFACHSVRIDRIRLVYNKKRGPEYPFWSSVVLDFVLYWFLFSLIGELMYITASPNDLNAMAVERAADCGYNVALLLAFLLLQTGSYIYRFARVVKIKDPVLGHHRTLVAATLGLLVQLLFVVVETAAGAASSVVGGLEIRATHTALTLAVVMLSILLTHGAPLWKVYTAKSQLVTTENFLRAFKGHMLFDDADVELQGMSHVISQRIKQQTPVLMNKSSRGRFDGKRD